MALAASQGEPEITLGLLFELASYMAQNRVALNDYDERAKELDAASFLGTGWEVIPDGFGEDIAKMFPMGAGFQVYTTPVVENNVIPAHIANKDLYRSLEGRIMCKTAPLIMVGTRSLSDAQELVNLHIIYPEKNLSHLDKEINYPTESTLGTSLLILNFFSKIVGNYVLKMLSNPKLDAIVNKEGWLVKFVSDILKKSPYSYKEIQVTDFIVPVPDVGEHMTPQLFLKTLGSISGTKHLEHYTYDLITVENGRGIYHGEYLSNSGIVLLTKDHRLIAYQPGNTGVVLSDFKLEPGTLGEILLIVQPKKDPNASIYGKINAPNFTSSETVRETRTCSWPNRNTEYGALMQKFLDSEEFSKTFELLSKVYYGGIEEMSGPDQVTLMTHLVPKEILHNAYCEETRGTQLSFLVKPYYEEFLKNIKHDAKPIPPIQHLYFHASSGVDIRDAQQHIMSLAYWQAHSAIYELVSQVDETLAGVLADEFGEKFSRQVESQVTKQYEDLHGSFRRPGTGSGDGTIGIYEGPKVEEIAVSQFRLVSVPAPTETLIKPVEITGAGANVDVRYGKNTTMPIPSGPVQVYRLHLVSV